MGRMVRGLVLVCAVLALAACGSDNDSKGGGGGGAKGGGGVGGGGVGGAKGKIVGSCDIKAQGLCVDYTGPAFAKATAQQVKDACTQGNGAYSTGACTGTGLVASCLFNKGQENEVIARGYAPMTKEQAVQGCQQDGGELF